MVLSSAIITYNVYYTCCISGITDITDPRYRGCYSNWGGVMFGYSRPDSTVDMCIAECKVRGQSLAFLYRVSIV